MTINKKIYSKYSRYLIVLLIFAFAFLFMKEFKLSENEGYVRQIAGLEDRIDNLQNQVYVISKDDSGITIEDFLSSTYGDSYRISYQVKKTNLISMEDQTALSDLEVILADKDGNTQFLNVQKVASGYHFESRDIVFIADGRYKEIVFRIKDQNDRSIVELKNVKINRLNCKNISCISNLDESIYGNTNRIKEDQKMAENLEPIYKYDSSNSNFGQIFKSTKDNITSVSLSFRVIGSGGVGPLKLNLKKVTENHEGYVVSEEVLSTFGFSVNELDKYRVAKDIYNFPLPAYLQPGQHYFIGISNKDADSNFFHTIRLLGSSDRSSYVDGQAKLVGSKKQFGDLYFKTEYKLDYLVNSIKIPLNSSIEDLGGEKLYSFSYTRSPYDFFDIFEMSSDPITRPYLDTGSRSITAQSLFDAYFTYKIDTIEPFSAMRISYEQISGHNKNTVGYYSFNNSDWIRIEGVDPDNRNVFIQNLVGGNESQVYIKFTYDRDDIGKQNNIFGVRNLDINASIDGE